MFKAYLIESTADDPPSEPVTPIMTAQPDVQPSGNDSCTIEYSEKISIDPGARLV